MKPSVAQALSQRAVPVGQELDAINNELRPILDGCRTVANAESIFRVSVNSSDSPLAYKRLWESEAVPGAGTWLVEARVVGIDADGDAAAYVLTGVFVMGAGIPTQLGADNFIESQETVAGFSVRYGADLASNTVYVEAIDGGVATSWVAVVKVLEAI